MRDWHELKEMLCKELEEYSRKGKMSAGDLETIHKLTDTIKNIDKIGMLEDGEYSHAAGNRMPESYRRQRRDRRGRYSRDGGYSYDDGMAEVWEILEMMENGLPDEQREAIRRFRREMQK